MSSVKIVKIDPLCEPIKTKVQPHGMDMFFLSIYIMNTVITYYTYFVLNIATH